MKYIFSILFLFISFATAGEVRRFAEVIDGKVLRVIVGESLESVQKILPTKGMWVETYKSTVGKNYAGKDYIYYPDKYNFSIAKPDGFFVLDASCVWISTKVAVVSTTDTVKPK